MARRTSSHLVLLSLFRALHGLGRVVSTPTLQVRMVSTFAGGESEEEPGSTGFWMKLLFSCILVLLGGVFAGLTIGLMGLDDLHLRVLSVSSDDEVERKNASKVLSLLRKGRHWVLVVLLLGNVIVNESLPIFLDSAIGGGVAAVVISTALIGAWIRDRFLGKADSVISSVIFGEYVVDHLQRSILSYAVLRVIPQAVCARHGLSIGAKCAPLVAGLMYILAPIAYPTAKLLDYVLGANEEHTYKKAELRSFLQFHRQGEEPLRDDEIAILNGVLELNTKTLLEIMTPIQDVVTLSADAVLDHTLVDKILVSGYSRFPVHEPGNPKSFLGLLLIKKLLSYDPSEEKKVSDLPLSILPEAGVDINCFQALDYFQTGRAHLLLVSKTPGIPGGALGVVTLEDIIEEIIAEEIVDEFDRYEDNQSKRMAKRKGTAEVMKGIVEHVKRRAGNSDFSQAGLTTVIREGENETTPLISRVASPDPGDASHRSTQYSDRGTDGSRPLQSGSLTPTQEYRAREYGPNGGGSNGNGGPSYGATLNSSPPS
ncbi:hypothetical protein ACEPAI_1263 [Sanghuangporus weigelae]